MMAIVIVKAASTREINESDIIASSSFSSTITVNIIGEVKNPGIHNLISNSPIMQSISAAGGYTEIVIKRKLLC